MQIKDNMSQDKPILIVGSGAGKSCTHLIHEVEKLKKEYPELIVASLDDIKNGDFSPEKREIKEENNSKTKNEEMEFLYNAPYLYERYIDYDNPTLMSFSSVVFFPKNGESPRKAQRRKKKQRFKPKKN